MQETSEEIMRQLEMMDNNQTNFQVLKLSKQANKIAKQILQVKMNLPISFQILKTLAIYLAMKQSKKNLIKQIFHRNLKEQIMLFLIQIHQNLKIQIITMEQNEKLERKWEVLTNKSSKIWSLIYLLMIEGKLYTYFVFFWDGEDFKQKLFKKIFNAIFLTCNFTIRFFWLMNL